MTAGGVAVMALAAGLAACSLADDTGAPPPTVDETRALEDARSMIPEAEQSATGTTQGDNTATKETPTVNPTIKPAFATPVPGAERAE